MKAPKCKTCGTEHWGLCHDHNLKGAMADQRPMDSRAKATKGKAAAAQSVKADGVASRPSNTVEVLQGAPVKAARAAIQTAEAAAAHLAPQKRGRGRPKSISDMKAYKAQKAKERRDRLRGAKLKGSTP
jgi:hypothetical protein